MEKEKLIKELSQFEAEMLSVHNKIQEAVSLARDGKWYHADTKMQGTKQKVLNLYSDIQSLQKELNNENNTN